MNALNDFCTFSFRNVCFFNDYFSVSIEVFLVIVLEGPKEIVKASVQERLDKRGKNDPSNSDSYENLSVCDQTCPS